jgi:putative redox protein
MVNLEVNYQGELRCLATHGPSGKQLTTDAPVDNHGKGETFSPTDLVGTALGACLLTVMGIAARAKQIALDGTHVSVSKEMTSQLPRRIARLTTVVTFPREVAGRIGDADRRQLEEVAENCPVRLSLSAAVEVPMQFKWE